MISIGAHEDVKIALGLETYSAKAAINSHFASLKKLHEQAILNIMRLQTKVQNQSIILQLENAIQKESSLKIQFEVFEERVASSECMICYETSLEGIICTCCHHLYCRTCFESIIKTQVIICAYCRTPFYKSFIEASRSQIEIVRDLLTKLSQETETKTLICGKFDSIYTELFSQINPNLWTFVKGNSNVISNIIKKFIDGNIKFLCLISEYSCAGLNLEHATDLILFNGIPKNKRLQFIGRAQRPGRVTPLVIHELVISKPSFLLHIKIQPIV